MNFDKSLASWIEAQQPQDDRSERSTQAGRDIAATFRLAQGEPLEKSIPPAKAKKTADQALVVQIDKPAPIRKSFGTSPRTGKPYKKPIQVVQDNESPRRLELKKSLETVARLCPLDGEELQLTREQFQELDAARQRILELVRS